jgi:hypothetical protein
MPSLSFMEGTLIKREVSSTAESFVVDCVVLPRSGGEVFAGQSFSGKCSCAG